MCDTIVVTPDASADGVMLFSKNSDRDPNEAQYLSYIPEMEHKKGSRLKCTYIEIPQVLHTHAVLLSKPFWIWGAEMGVNQHGVAIGNEAIFSKVPAQKEPALLGMDLLRLGLERASSAAQAVQVITSLLEEFGQGGNCGFQHKIYYHNSFLIADAKEAWVLETVGREWAACQVRGVYSISNCLTLGNQWDQASPQLISFAQSRGWCKGKEDFDFARCYSDFLFTTFSAGRQRCQRTHQILEEKAGSITLEEVIAVLRHHRDGSAEWRPDRGLTGADVCMHAAFGPVRISQTTGSLVSYLHPTSPIHFVTATAAPCTSLFKPLWMDVPLPDMGEVPQGTYNPNSLFWKHEFLHRLVLGDYPTRIERFRSERDELEMQFIAQAFQMKDESVGRRRELAEESFKQAQTALQRWIEAVERTPIRRPVNRLYASAWNSFNRQAGMPLSY